MGAVEAERLAELLKAEGDRRTTHSHCLALIQFQYSSLHSEHTFHGVCSISGVVLWLMLAAFAVSSTPVFTPLSQKIGKPVDSRSALTFCDMISHIR